MIERDVLYFLNSFYVHMGCMSDPPERLAYMVQHIILFIIVGIAFMWMMPARKKFGSRLFKYSVLIFLAATGCACIFNGFTHIVFVGGSCASLALLSCINAASGARLRNHLGHVSRKMANAIAVILCTVITLLCAAAFILMLNACYSKYWFIGPAALMICSFSVWLYRDIGKERVEEVSFLET